MNAGIFKAIFKPNDGSRQQVRAAVAASAEKVQGAANRFEQTVRDLLDENDRLTGRKKDSAENSRSQ